ncbi:hypothetical protein ACFX15_003786 [Malus domestica]
MIFSRLEAHTNLTRRLSFVFSRFLQLEDCTAESNLLAAQPSQTLSRCILLFCA